MRKLNCLKSMWAWIFLLSCVESNGGTFAINPASATAGSSVTISGGNFSAVAANNVVYFGAVQAGVVTASTNSLTVTVPSGATYAPVTVTVNGLTAYSDQPFLPMFVGNGAGISASTFAPRLTLPSGADPVRVIVADLDGDGKPDLVVVSYGDHTISLYRNISTNGLLTAASFAPRVVLAAPSGAYTPFDIEVADVDGDGKLDIIAADNADNLVSVYHNACTPGSITSNAFATRVDFATGTSPVYVAVRDLDGDGKPDIIVANDGDGTVSILRNISVMGSLTTNSFAPRVDIATGTGCYAVAAGDLDGDGKPDLVTANSANGTVSVLRNLSSPGNIAFAPVANLVVETGISGGGPMQVSIGDLDGDGKPDLAVVSYDAQILSVFRNISTNGSLTAGSFVPRVDYALGGRGHSTAIADFDGDGKPDIAVVTEMNSMLSIFRNMSAPGSWASNSLAARVDFATGYNPCGVSVGDLDGDGRPEIVFCNVYDGTISICQNTAPLGITTGAPGIFRQPASQTANAGMLVAFSALANGSPSTLQWYFGTNAVAAPGGTASPLSVTASDETAGNYTAVFSNSYGTATSTVAVLTVIDPPLITAPPVSLTNLAGTTATFSVTAGGTVPLQYHWRKNGSALADGGNVSGSATNTLTLTNVSAFDIAGYDVVVANAAGSVTSLVASLTVLAPPSITIQPSSVSDIAGTTATFQVAAIGTATLSYQWRKNNAGMADGGNVSGSATATLTLTNISQGDAGTYSVLVTNSLGSILSSNAVLTVMAAPIVPAIISFQPGSAAAGSIVTISGTNFSAVAANNIVYFGAVQAGVVTASANSLTVTVPSGATYAPITVTVNGLTAYSVQPFMPTFVGSGLGISASTFAPRLDLAAGNNPYQVVIADLDGDGKPDLVVANIQDNTISLYRNISANGPLTTASFAPRVNLPTPSGGTFARCLAVADVDGDGKLDIICTDYSSNLVSVFLNTCAPGSLSASNFAARVDYPTGSLPLGVVVRDLDSDGKPDLVVANSGDGTVSILRNTSVMGRLTASSFAPKVDIATSSGCTGVAVGDLDGDGIPDLVTANFGSGTVSVLRNLSSPGNFAFAARADLIVSSSPFNVAIGDLDGDGKPDLAVACYYAQTLSVFRNTSTVGSLTTNSFAPRVDFSLGGRGHIPVIADLDGDGKADLAVVTELNSMLAIFRNVSAPGSLTNSSFATRVDLSSGWNAWGLTAGDLDGDGRPDVVFCNQYDGSVSIYQNMAPFGNISGAPVVVQQPASRTANAGTPVAFSALANGSPSTLQWYFGTNALAAPGGTASPLSVTASDATAGNYTAVFSNSYGTATSAVAVLTVIDPPLITAPPASITNLAGTTASFSVTASGTVPLQYGWRKNGLRLIDGGKVSGSATNTLTLTNVSASDIAGYDVVVANAAGSVTSLVASLTVLAPPSILVQPASVSDFAGTSATFTVAAIGTATLNYAWQKNSAGLTDGGNVFGSATATLTLTNITQGDAGTYAVLVTNSFGSILSSNAVLTVTAAPIVPVIFSFGPGIAAPNANLIISGTNFSPVPAQNIAYLGAVRATVASASATNLTVTVPVGATYAPVTVTVNGLTACSAQPFMPTFSGNGSGLGASSFAPRFNLAAGNNPYQVVIADLDGDGKPDLVVANIQDNSISLYRNISTNGSLTAASFAPRVNLATPSGGTFARFLAVADLDGDGKLDIICTDYSSNLVSVFLNTCSPGSVSPSNFAARVDYPTGSLPLGVVVRDLDGDGKPDLVVANSGDGTVSILRNTSVMGSLTARSFAPKVDIATGGGCFTVAAGDLDGDGKPDLAVANSGNGTVSVLRNLSSPANIAFAPAANLVVQTGVSGGGPFGVSIGDLDGDGKPDLAVASYNAQLLSVFRNISTNGSLTTNSFAHRIDYALPGRGHVSAIGDLDGDGKPDIAVVTEMSSWLSIFRNVSAPGSWTNSSLAARLDFAAGSNPWGVAVGDLDGDGRPEVLFCNQYDGTVSIYQNTVPYALPPTIASQPTNQTVGVGGSATFSVVAAGSPPFSYQWSFDGTNIPGATSNSLTLAGVQSGNAGTYSVVVSNSIGWAASSNAVLAIASTLQVAGVSASGAGIVTVPVNLLAMGDESALAFSLDFDSAVLTFEGVRLGSGAAGAFMFANTNQAAGGRIGLDIAFFNGAFSSGTQQVVAVTFQAALVTNTVATSVGFGDVPTSRQIAGAFANTIPATYLAGTVTVVPTGLEGDVWPRTNGDYSIGVNDWVQEGRFVAGLDTLSNAFEFQRADCAPRDTSGDGAVTIIDWIQVGRYAAGLDPLTPAGGPTGAQGSSLADSHGGKITPHDALPRTLSISPLTKGSTASSVMVQLQAQGDESGLQFSVSFDPAEMSFAGASLGAGAAGAALFANTNNLAAGQLGLALALPYPATFAAGAQPIVQLAFNSISYSNTAYLLFADSPLVRQVGDITANPVSATYLNGSMVVGGAPWPQLAISQSGGNIVLSWPASAGGLGAQMTPALGGNWTGAGGAPVTNGSTILLTLPAPATATYFRLCQP